MKTKLGVKDITFMAMMAALNVSFCLIGAFVPLAGLFLSIALPLSSALVAVKARTAFYPIYALATLGLCIIVTPAQIDTTLFYVLPSLLLGLAFGLLFKLKWAPLLIIISASYIQLGLLYVTIALIDALFMIDFVNALLTLLAIDHFSGVALITPTLLYAISLAQSTLIYLIVGAELRKVTLLYSDKPISIWVTMAFSLMNGLVVLLGRFAPMYGHLLLGPLFMLAGYHLFRFVETKKTALLICGGAWLIITVFLGAILFPIVEKETALLLTSIFPLGIFMIVLFDFCLPLLTSGHKMNSRG